MNPIVPIFSKFLKNKSGFTLMELMMVTGMLALFTLAVTELIRGQKALVIESEIAADMTQMKAEIQSLLSSHQHCNANFSKKALGDQPAIYTCSTSGEFDCIPLSDSLGSPVEKFKRKSGTDWTNTGSASNRVRIVSIITKFEALKVPLEDALCDEACKIKINEALDAGLKTNASMTVQFEKKYSSTKTTEEEVTFTTPVIDMGKTSRTFTLIFRVPEKCSNSWNYLNMETIKQ